MSGKKIKFLFGLAFALSLLVSCVAGQPVRQPRKSCVECHADIAAAYKQGVVHRPVQEDKCTTPCL